MTIGGITFADLTSSTLVGAFVISILLGKLVPKTTLQDTMQERDRWREAYEAEREARGDAEAQTQELIERTRRLHDILSVNHGELESQLTEG